MKIFLTIALTIFLAGCFGTAEKKPSVDQTMKAGVLDKAFTLANVPLFRMTCPPQGCVIGSLEVGNPSAVSQLAPIVSAAVATPRSQWLDAYIATLGAVKDVGTYAVVGHFAKGVMGNIVDGYSAGFDSNALIASHIPQPAANISTVTNNTVTNTIGRDGVIGDGSSFSRVSNRSETNISCMFSATTGPGGTGACR